MVQVGVQKIGTNKKEVTYKKVGDFFLDGSINLQK